ncbi:hypothetical protein PROFUN_01462 [Planoprotostelium fungivorum]|uniref:Basal body-orientation factor 1 n=1 Tax=Planoprotostelium fungivorum TaxID=1890364 RepID=A0A2P6NTE9_9EUKA|nr:hypothetical protein PROFUN_01462 [Planoprotostelium fungivorum]
MTSHSPTRSKAQSAGGLRRSKDATEGDQMSRSMKEFLKTYGDGWRNDITEEFKTKQYKLQQEIEELKRQKHDAQVESTDIIEHLRSQCETKDKQLEETRAKKIAVEQGLEKSAKDIEYVLQNEIINLKSSIAHKDRLIKEMEEENEMLNEYKMHRAQYAHDVEHYKQEIEGIKQKHKDKIARLERKFYDEKISLQKQFQQKLMELRKISHEEAVTKLGETTKQLFVENRTMTEELQLQLQTTEKLKVKQKQLTSENKRLAREVEIQEEKEQEYASQQHQRTVTIKKLSERIGNLEVSNENLKAETIRSVSNASAQMKRELDDSKLDIEGMKRLLELKNKDLKRIKKLARRVLEQRSQLEQFFLDAIEHARSEATRERHGNRFNLESSHTFVTDHTTSLSLPSISRGKTPDAVSVESVPQTQHVSEELDERGLLDIDQMGWEDKERVLRMVFARINGSISGDHKRA